MPDHRRAYLAGIARHTPEQLAAIVRRHQLLVVDCRSNPRGRPRLWDQRQLEPLLQDDLTWIPTLGNLGFSVADRLTAENRERWRAGIRDGFTTLRDTGRDIVLLGTDGPGPASHLPLLGAVLRDAGGWEVGPLDWDRALHSDPVDAGAGTFLEPPWYVRRQGPEKRGENAR